MCLCVSGSQKLPGFPDFKSFMFEHSYLHMPNVSNVML